ncbi:acetyl-coenzyme A transporter 1-like isoform X2 [Homalodisca vitripennis]|nr:acetyl-coenzyme A transporter 1-like isoform X2 [Homalodisca vitripennis]
MALRRKVRPEDEGLPLFEEVRDDDLKDGEVSCKERSLTGDRANVALLFFLYTLQGIPLGLASAMPMLLQNRKGVLYKDQALFSLVAWPFSIKLLWAPIVDSVFSERFGRRKTWLVSSQYMIGIFMILLSYRVDLWVSDPKGPHTILLTCLFFALNFLAATQDIAVDGWALTMLKRENVGLASTCNSVGQTAGYFLGYVVFIALESADFCNTYLRTEHQPEGVVTLPNFLYYMGGIFLLSTTLVALFKREAPDEDNGEQDKDIKGTYQQLLRIVRLPAVRTLALILLTCKVSFCACDAIAGLKLVEAGVPREQFAMVALFLIPLQVSLPLLLTRYLVSDAPMDVYTKAIPYRLAFNLLAAAFVWLTPHLITKDHIPFHYYVLLILLYGLHQITLYSMFVSQLSFFFARISDPNMGGTYMTLLNTLANLGTSWPNSLILLFVDGFSSSYCSNDPDNNCSCASLIEQCTTGAGECVKWLDGFYVLIVLCTLYGVVWMRWGRHTVHELQRRGDHHWKLSLHKR